MRLTSKLTGEIKRDSGFSAVGQFEICGQKIRCSVCGNPTFSHRTAQLNTALASFLKLDWANKTASTLICSKCTHIHWFHERPENVGEVPDE